MDTLKIKIDEKASGLENEKVDIEEELGRLDLMESELMRILGLVWHAKKNQSKDSDRLRFEVGLKYSEFLKKFKPSKEKKQKYSKFLKYDEDSILQ